MTDDRMALMEASQKADDGNFLRNLAETVLQILMEADVEGMIGPAGTSAAAKRTPASWFNPSDGSSSAPSDGSASTDASLASSSASPKPQRPFSRSP